MASTTSRLLSPKSLLLRLVISPLPRFCSTDTEFSQVVETECYTAKKPLNNLRTESNPPKISEISKQYQCPLPNPTTPTNFQLETRYQFDKAVNIFRTESDPEKLVQIFKESAEKRSIHHLQSMYRLTVKKLASAKHFDAIEEILDHSLQAMCEMNEHESALTLLDEMRKHGCERHSPIYNTILSAFYKQGKYMEAADLLAQMFETGCADVSTYNIMMGILCESDKTRDAEKLLDEMVSTRLKPNISHFNTLIAGFCKDNNLTEAKRIFSDISRKGFKPDAVTYSTLISFLLKEGDFDMAYEYCIESMLRKWMPKLKIAKMLIDGLVKNNKVEKAREVIEGRKKNLPAFCHKDLETISP